MKLKNKISFLTTGIVLCMSLILSFVVLKALQGNLTAFHDAVISPKVIQDVLENIGADITIVGMILVVVTLSFTLILSAQITRKVVNINESLKLLEKGMLPENLTIASKDEIGEIGKRINSITNNLKETAHYTEEIGKGNFDNSFQLLSDNDVLRSSLLGMTSSLRNADKREKERAWVVNSIAEIGDILRKSNTLDALSDNVVKFLVERINAVQGAFYIVVDDDTKRTTIEMKSAYAYNRKKYIKKTFVPGEGLAGQAVVEMSSILRTEIPDDYFSITSGILGDMKPSCIFITPLISDEKVFGVMEFAGLNKFSDNDIKLMEESGPIIARTIFNIQVTENTTKHGLT